MSQAPDYSFSNQSGAAFRAELNVLIMAIATLNSGASEPGTTYAHMLWMDTTLNLIKKRNAANDDWLILPINPLADYSVKADTIAEGTATSGVTIDGLTLKDAGIAVGSDADGDLYYRDSGALARLGKGTSGQVLTSDGSVPGWGTPAGVPTGVMMDWSGAAGSPPAGWLHCNGDAVSRETYDDLFAVVGTTYGVGNGSTTFNLPDFRNRMAVGSEDDYARGDTAGAATVALTTAEMAAHTHLGPSHDHDVQDRTAWGTGAAGGTHADVPTSYSGKEGVTWASIAQYVKTVAAGTGATGSTGSGSAHENMPPYLGCPKIIKT